MASASPRPDTRPTRRYLVERYLPGLTLEGLRRDEASIHEAARLLTAGGRSTSYLGCTFVPSEGTVLAVFEATDVAWVIEANRIAGSPVDRIVDVVDRRNATTPRRAGPGRTPVAATTITVEPQKEEPCC